jgi:pimeloyl-ACP methyl ester carboxylesterase
VSAVPPQPTLYLHGDQDGCMAADVSGTVRSVLPPRSDVAVVEGAGHFLHLERPDEVNRRIVGFLGG